jgi:hypothetical protein
MFFNNLYNFYLSNLNYQTVAVFIIGTNFRWKKIKKLNFMETL